MDMTDGSRYFDRQGRPIPAEEWIRLSSDPAYRRVALTSGYCRRISTVWLGLNHQWGDGPPLIFETMLFRESPSGDNLLNDIDCDRYSTEAEAVAGHEKMCQQHIWVLDRIVHKVFDPNAVVDDTDE